MKDNKLKKFWNDHKVAIIIAGGTILSVALVAVGVRRKAETRRLLEGSAALTNAVMNSPAINEIKGLVDEFVKEGIVPEGTTGTMIITF